MRKIKVVLLLVRQLQHGFTKNAKVSPNCSLSSSHLNIFLKLKLLFFDNFLDFLNPPPILFLVFVSPKTLAVSNSTTSSWLHFLLFLKCSLQPPRHIS